MGWTGTYKTRDHALNDGMFGKSVKPGMTWEADGKACTLLARHDVPDATWLLCDLGGTVTIICAFVEVRGGGWWEGGLWGEDSGPYRDGCPVAWFDRAPVPGKGEQRKWAIAFRERHGWTDETLLLAAIGEAATIGAGGAA